MTTVSRYRCCSPLLRLRLLSLFPLFLLLRLIFYRQGFCRHCLFITTADVAAAAAAAAVVGPAAVPAGFAEGTVAGPAALARGGSGRSDAASGAAGSQRSSAGGRRPHARGGRRGDGMTAGHGSGGSGGDCSEAQVTSWMKG